MMQVKAKILTIVAMYVMVTCAAVAQSTNRTVMANTNGYLVAPPMFFHTNLFAGTNVIFQITNGTGIVIHSATSGGGSAGETNYNANAGLTNSTRGGWVFGKTDVTNFIKTVTLSLGDIFDQGTNLLLQPQILLNNTGGGMTILPTGIGNGFTVNTLAASGGLVWHSNANLLTVSNSILASPTTTQGDIIVRGTSVDERLGLHAFPWGRTLRSETTNVYWGGIATDTVVYQEFNLHIAAWIVSNGSGGTSDPWRTAYGQDNTMLFLTGTNASGFSAIHLGYFDSFHPFSNGPVYFQCRVYVPVLSSTNEGYNFRIGLIDSSAAESADGVYFRHSTNTTAIEFVTAKNSSRTVSVCLSNVLNAWQTWGYLINSNATEAIAFAGTSESDMSPVATNTSNIPNDWSRSTSPGISMASHTGTTSETNVVDYYYLNRRYFNR